MATLQANAELNDLPGLVVEVPDRQLLHGLTTFCVPCGGGKELLWGNGAHLMTVSSHGPFTHILGSDLVYNSAAWSPLLTTLDVLVSEGTVIWLAFPERPDAVDNRNSDAEGFLSLARDQGFQAVELHRDGFISVWELRCSEEVYS